MTNVSSTYLNQHTALCVACSIAFFSKSSMKKFTITGESGEPKHSVLASLVHRAKALCDEDSLAQETKFLTTVFKDNGYSPQQIRRAMKPSAWTPKTNDKPTSTAYIPYTQKTFGRLSRMLAKHNIKSVALPPRKISTYFPPVKDALGLRTPGVYSIPFECGEVYTGQSG